MTTLEMLKLSIGDVTPNATELNDYYNNFILQANALLLSNDISQTVLATDLGKSAVVLIAIDLINGKDVSSNKTVNFMINTLTINTKAERLGG